MKAGMLRLASLARGLQLSQSRSSTSLVSAARRLQISASGKSGRIGNGDNALSKYMPCARFCSYTTPKNEPLEILPLPEGISNDRMQMYEIIGTEGTAGDGRGFTSVFAVHGPPELWSNQKEVLHGANGGCFAIFEAGGTQHKVTADNALYLNRIDGEVNEQVVFDKVLLLGSIQWTVFGRPYIPGATVVATIEEQTRSGKVHILKFKKRKGYRRLKGHRQSVTRIRINEVVYPLPTKEILKPFEIELDPKRPPLSNSPRFL